MNISSNNTLTTTIAMSCGKEFGDHQKWAEDAISNIRHKLKACFFSVLEIAEIYFVAKEKLAKGQYVDFVKKTGVSDSYASKMLTISKWANKTFSPYYSIDPDSPIPGLCDGYSTVYELCDFTVGQLTDLTEKISCGAVKQLTRSKIQELFGNSSGTINDTVSYGSIKLSRSDLAKLDDTARNEVCRQLKLLKKNVGKLKLRGVLINFDDGVLDKVIADCCVVSVSLNQAA